MIIHGCPWLIRTPIVTKRSSNNGPRVPGGCWRSPQSRHFPATPCWPEKTFFTSGAPKGNGSWKIVAHGIPIPSPWGSISKKKVEWDLGLSGRTVAASGQASFNPPHHHTPLLPKRGHPGTGGYRGESQKIPWGIVLSSKMMILQAVKHPISYIQVRYPNTRQNGAGM